MALFGHPCAVFCLAVLFIGSANAAVQGVFAHYMVGGMSSINQAMADVTQAQSLGLDAFALNVQQPDAGWAHASLAFLFDAASQVGFKLFFSMDMAAIPSPSACLPLLTKYASHPAYYHYQNRPFLSTFRGGAPPNANAQWKAALQTLTPKPYFIPNFDDHPSVHAGVYPPSILTTAFPDVDGLMGWETAWPFPGVAIAAQNDSTTPSPDALNLAAITHPSSQQQHQQAQAQEAHPNPPTRQRTYMMPLSTHQSKHHPAYGNWLRRGGLALPRRLLDALALRPAFVQLVSWNDAGEGHDFGNVWPEALPDRAMRAVAEGWAHAAWRGLVRVFAAALKADGSGGIGSGGIGAAAVVVPVDGGQFVGAFWYRPLLKGAECGTDRLGLGKPAGWEDVEDVVSVVVVLARESKGVRVRVWSGGDVAGEFEGVAGMNMYEVGVNKGEQVVQLVAGDGRVIGEGKSKVDVTDRIEDLGGICNFNYQVVEIARL